MSETISAVVWAVVCFGALAFMCWDAAHDFRAVKDFCLFDDVLRMLDAENDEDDKP